MNSCQEIIFIMGVSGSGKTTVGTLLSEKTGIPFFDGDDFHSGQNIKKMESGIPLDDQDRKGWLQSINEFALRRCTQSSAIIACSALREKYRNILSKGLNRIKWIFLKGSRSTIASRMLNRADHFMPIELLQSQFQTLEPPSYAIEVDIDQPAEDIVDEILQHLTL